MYNPSCWSGILGRGLVVIADWGSNKQMFFLRIFIVIRFLRTLDAGSHWDNVPAPSWHREMLVQECWLCLTEGVLPVWGQPMVLKSCHLFLLLGITVQSESELFLKAAPGRTWPLVTELCFIAINFHGALRLCEGGGTTPDANVQKRIYLLCHQQTYNGAYK